ncbi:FG-GAP-like repeat-containing protein [Streptomyces sp. NPDC048845]|uniref:FG-GAP-like repeat-containing protein n=1 Tax=Streptomyces sp. NPDC048845 TaxID=3155390 RepID=UPI0034427A13
MSPRTTHAYRPLSPRRRAWLTLGALVLGGGGVVTYAVAGPNEDRAGAGGKTKRPVAVHDIALKNTGKGKRELQRTGTEPFSLLGVTWTGAAKKLDGSAQVRTRSSDDGKWGPWRDLEADESHPPETAEPGVRGGSEPLWVGPSDGVEVQVVAGDGTTSAGLPKGMKISLVDPGVTAAEAEDSSSELDPVAFAAEETPPGSPSPGVTSDGTAGPGESATATPTSSAAPTGSDAPTGSGTPSSGTPTGSAPASPSPTATVPTAPPSTVTQPPVISRAGWGADESMVEEPPTYIDRVDAAFVHHTVGSNSYSCAESPALVRGIMAYHVQSEGWNDLGYNFLVDKCGQIFEGRGGGIDLPVTGAHTYGFNSYSTGIAVLGDFHGDPAKGIAPGEPTRAALESVARVAAWKLGQYGGDPAGEVTLTAKGDTGVWETDEEATIHRISGHRDGFATACPGTTLYAKLGEIRRFAASPGADSAVPTSDTDRDGIADLVAGTPKTSSGAGSLTVVPGGTEGPVAEAGRTLTQNSAGVPGGSESGDSFGAATAWGDLNGDGYADLAVGAPGENLSATDQGAVTVLYGPGLDSGSMYTTTGVTASGAKLGSAVTIGDFDADGKADLFSAGTGGGGNWNVRHTDGGTKYGTLTSATGSVAYMDATTGDFNRDGYADVALNYRDTGGTGRVTWFEGSSSGLVKVGNLSVRGGRSVDAGDVNGNGYDDLVIGQAYTAESNAKAGGQVTVVPGTSTGFTTTGMKTIHQDTSGVPGAAEAGDALGWSVSVGDYDLDGYADVLAGLPNEDLTRSGTSRKNAGATLLLRGTSAGLTGSGARALSQDTSGVPGVSESGDQVGSSVVLQDLSGWGRADLAIGVQGEDSGNGTILQLDSGSAGVSTTGAVYYGRGALGLPSGAAIGRTLTP